MFIQGGGDGPPYQPLYTLAKTIQELEIVIIVKKQENIGAFGFPTGEICFWLDITVILVTVE